MILDACAYKQPDWDEVLEWCIWAKKFRKISAINSRAQKRFKKNSGSQTTFLKTFWSFKKFRENSRKFKKLEKNLKKLLSSENVSTY